MATERICKHCGEPESYHCEFEAIIVPRGCVCDVGSWDGASEIPAPCRAYVGDGKTHCATCEHDKECHGN